MLARITIRHLVENDLGHLVECERLSHQNLSDYAWRREDFLAAIHQRKVSTRGKKDTRSLVATLDGVVQACLIYEIHDDGYEVLSFTAHPEASADARKALLYDVLLKSRRSKSRKLLSMTVPDGHYQLLGFLMEQGWTHKLLYNPLGNDFWRCEFSTGVITDERSHAM